jgi:hypothetical protein
LLRARFSLTLPASRVDHKPPIQSESAGRDNTVKKTGITFNEHVDHLPLAQLLTPARTRTFAALPQEARAHLASCTQCLVRLDHLMTALRKTKLRAQEEFEFLEVAHLKVV